MIPSTRARAEPRPSAEEIRRARDRHTARVLSLPLVRASVLMPSVVALGYGVFVGGIADARAFVVIVATALILAVVGIARPWPRDPERAELAQRLETGWQVFSGTVGILLIAPYLVLAVDAEAALFAPVFAVIIVTMLFSLPWRWRIPLASWVVVVWILTLLWGGMRDLPTLVLQIGGAVLVVLVTVRISTVLSDNVVAADELRSAAERRAHLLASVLRTNSLDPDDVFRAGVDGLMEVGFDIAAIRVVDHGRRVARLVEGTARIDADLVVDLPIAGTVLPEVIETRRPVVITDVASDARISGQLKRLAGMLFVPIFDEGVVHAVIVAGTRERPVDDEAIDAAALLAEQAGAALLRARSFHADRRTVDELRRLDLRTQDFVSTVSHELRTPLTVVRGLGQTLLNRWDDLDPVRREDLLSRVDANADRLADMVRSLLDTSAVESGDLTPRVEPIAVDEEIRVLLHRSVGVTSVHPIEVAIPATVHAKADRGLFGHVMENLLNNLAKHTPRGTRATISATRVGDRVRISVADEGPGIPADDLPHVLDRFYRGGEPDRRSSSGLGLGLALAREAVRAHDGNLEVDSEVGKGTRFSFDLPAIDPEDV